MTDQEAFQWLVETADKYGYQIEMIRDWPHGPNWFVSFIRVRNRVGDELYIGAYEDTFVLAVQALQAKWQADVWKVSRNPARYSVGGAGEIPDGEEE